ncbi:helix-turn-helix domain-containing protein, partial [Kitasatospora indigofera]
MTGTPMHAHEAIDALLGAGPRRPVPLPEPAERARLRTEYGLSKAETAKALKVSASTFTAWESGQRDPQGEGRAAYAKLLEGIAAQLAPAPPAPAPVPAAAPVPDPKTVTAPPPEAPLAHTAPQLVMLDQNPDGSLVMAAAAPCVQCAQPSVYRAQGMPMHLGGFCRPGVVPAAPAVPAAPPTPAPAPAAAPPVPSVSAPAQPAASPTTMTAPAASATTAPGRAAAPSQAAPATGPAGGSRRTATSRPAAGSLSRARKAPAKTAPAAEGPSDWEAAAAARFPSGPLAVLDVAPSGKGLVAYLADGTQAPTAPAKHTLAAVV